MIILTGFIVLAIFILRFLALRALDCNQPAHLPELSLDLIRQITEYSDVATATRLGEISMSLRRVTALRLSRRYSADYISNSDFRTLVNSRRHNARAHICLNLGDEFRRYMIDPDFNELVRSFVDDPYRQIWSDVERLHLDHTNVSDVTALASLTNLRGLSLHNTPIEDISPLALLPNLLYLTLHNTRVRDLSVFANLTKLELLHLGNSQVQDLDPLAGLTKIRVLNLDNLGVHDVSALADLPKLVELSLRHTQVEDLAPLARLTSLLVLNLDGTQVRDVSALADLRNLQRLSLRGTDVDVGSLAHLWTLRINQ